MPSNEVSLFQGRHFAHKKLQELLSSMPDGKMLGLKRPIYLYDYDTACNIKQHNPDAKLIVILRDPVERAVSDYYHAMNNALIPLEDIETGIPRILNGEISGNCPYAYQVIQHSKYSIYLDMYYSLFDKEQFLLLRQENIKIDAQKEMNRLFDFLGLEYIDVSKLSNEKFQNVIYNMKYIKWLALLRKIESLTNDQGIVLQRAVTTNPVKRYIINKSRNYIFSRQNVYEKKPISDKLAKQLTEYFKAEYNFLDQITV